MNSLLFTIGRALLDKNIPFCIYGLPDAPDFKLAVDKDILPERPGKLFWVAPFVRASSARDIFLNVVPESSLLNLIAKIRSLPDAPITWGTLPAQTSREAYFEAIHNYLSEIREGKLQKAILSRVEIVDRPEGFDPFICLRRMKKKYPYAFAHLLYHPDAGLWMGATPELLLKKNNECYQTMALAATQPVNETHQYKWNEKEKEEHEMVADHIVEVFRLHNCNISSRKEAQTIEAGKVAHLQTDFEFCSNQPLDLKKLLSDLHPTPAVGGLPAEKGVECILKYEGYDRRYYCGFIGETDLSDYACLFINLRCMQIGKDEIAVFSGGGITAASLPEAEWKETIQKSSTMLDTLIHLHEDEVVR